MFRSLVLRDYNQPLNSERDFETASRLNAEQLRCGRSPVFLVKKLVETKIKMDEIRIIEEYRGLPIRYNLLSMENYSGRSVERAQYQQVPQYIINGPHRQEWQPNLAAARHRIDQILDQS